MKRFFLFFCTLVLVCAFMVVPVLGSELLRFELTEDETNFFTLGEALHGEYLVSFLDSNYSPVISTGPYDFTYPNEVMDSFDYMGVTFDFSFRYLDDFNLQVSAVGCSDKCGSLKALFPDISYFVLTPVGSVPVPEPTMGFMESIGYFFSSCIAWVSQIASLIVSNPVLLVISVGIILVTFSVILFKRF